MNKYKNVKDVRNIKERTCISTGLSSPFFSWSSTLRECVVLLSTVGCNNEVEEEVVELGLFG